MRVGVRGRVEKGEQQGKIGTTVIEQQFKKSKNVGSSPIDDYLGDLG